MNKRLALGSTAGVLVSALLGTLAHAEAVPDPALPVGPTQAAFAPATDADPVDAASQAQALVLSARDLEREQPEEAVSRYLQAADLYEGIAEAQPDVVEPWWRAARAFWMAGDALPLDATEDRTRYFSRAEETVTAALAVHPECGECMLWKFAAMGRLRTTRGLWTGISQLPEMADLLDRGIALQPAHTDSEHNSTLGNLHYSSAVFYRVFPDWFWIGWAIGVRGDKERALGHSRTALALHPERLDYQIELGSQLLCLGATRSDRERLDKGLSVMRSAASREPETLDDAREIEAALIMIEHPKKSCGYAGDSWVEINGADARRAVSARGDSR